jgi:hypothetical protein
MERQHEEEEEEDEEEDDTASEMDSEAGSASTQIRVDVQDFEPGLRALEARGATGGADNFHKVVLIDTYHPSWDETIPIERLSLRRQFARFVTLLDRYGRERVRGFTFLFIRFDAPGLDIDEADLDRLFGEVLPSFPLLDRLRFQYSSLPIRHLGLFAARLSAEARGAARIAARPLLGLLDIENYPGDFAPCVPILAAMIRNNVPIRGLTLHAQQNMGRDACRQIFLGLQHNTNLRYLEVQVEQLFDDAIILPGDPKSALRFLGIYAGEWTDEGGASLARQLKTNTTLWELNIASSPRGGPVDHRSSPWIEMLESHNCTLRSVRLSGAVPDGTIAAYVRRNELIRRALDRMHEYHVSPPVLLPRVLHMVRTIPTLIYSFLRVGNVDALCDLLLVARQQQKSCSCSSSEAAVPTSDKRSRRPAAPLRRSSRVARPRK